MSEAQEEEKGLITKGSKCTKVATQQLERSLTRKGDEEK